MQIIHFILDEILKLLAYYTLFCYQSLQSCIKNSPIFWPTLYIKQENNEWRIVKD